MSEFVASEYAAGYAWAESLIDTYGVETIRNHQPAPWRSRDWCIGFTTCIGVTLERRAR